MRAEQIEYVYLETYSWAKAVKFWQELGFRVALDLGKSGRLEPVNGGPGIFLEEIPEGHPRATSVYLLVSEEFAPGAPVEVVRGWHDSHWGTRLMEIRDPDGRTFMLQAHPKKSP